MIHKIIDWLGYKLHIKKYTMNNLTQDLIGIVIGVCISTLALKTIAEIEAEIKLLPWYIRLWFWLGDKAGMIRIKVIGY